MKFHRVARVIAVSVAFWIVLVAGGRAENAAPGWDPNAFRDQSTLQIMTTGPEEGEHWSKLWLVVLDGQLYVRLGERSFARVQKNVTSPYVKVKISATGLRQGAVGRGA